MQPSDLLTVGGIAAVVIIVVQALKGAPAFRQLIEALGALVPITFGIVFFVVADISAGMPMALFLAVVNGIIAGASAAGIYQGFSATASTVAARASQPTVSDYDPKAPPEAQG